jgi:phosphonate transport system permease protein
MSKKDNSNESASVKTMKTGAKIIAVIIAILIYAYAVEVTQINLEEPQDPQRQAITTRVIRALARPDIFDYKEERNSVNVAIRIPCSGESSDFEFTPGGHTVVLSPNCADTTQDVITVTGEGFRPKTEGIIRWYPAGEVVTTRALTTFRTDGNGRFSEEFTMPDIRPTDELQRLEIEEKWRTSIITIEKIIETVFMALMATTVGTLLAVPISFIAARNLMAHVGAPLASIMMGIIAIPVGGFIGWQITAWLLTLAERTYGNAVVGIGIGIVSIVVAFVISLQGHPSLPMKNKHGYGKQSHFSAC